MYKCTYLYMHRLCHRWMSANASYSSAVAPSALQLVAKSRLQLQVSQSPAQMLHDCKLESFPGVR